MATARNLGQAFAEEAKNRDRYLVFAEKAEGEGMPQIARLFRAAAESELIHARAELEALGEIRSTVENLRYAVSAEENEFQGLYARFLKEALAEGDAGVAALFKNILAVERGHHALYSMALAAIADGQDLPERPVFVCRTCGNTVVGQPPEVCPVCGSPATAFGEVP